jgi:hypothetical protein
MHWHPTSLKDPVHSPGYRYSHSKYETAGLLPLVTLSELERWQTPYILAGLTNPRCIVDSHAIDPHISWLLASCTKSDPSPSHLQPVPLLILHHGCDIAISSADTSSLAATDLIWTEFVFLVRPGKYLGNAPDAHPLKLADVRLWVNGQQIDPLTACRKLCGSHFHWA